MKKVLCVIISFLTAFCLFSCGSDSRENDYTVGICNYVDDASLNQIVDSIKTRLNELCETGGVKIDVQVQNCNADMNVLSQIISNYEADKVDALVGVATPVAIALQSATEDSKTPVIYSAVSDPEGAGLVNKNGDGNWNICGVSDYLDTESLLNIIMALKPEAKKIGVLYDAGQDASKKPVEEARAYFASKGVEVIEHTGTNVDEIMLAADAMIAEGVDAIFTPTDNTVMKSELAIYEKLAEAGIPHFAGADSFALNGAFLGYGVDYVEIGSMTAEMIYDVLVDKKDISDLAVRQPLNGTATVNTEICEKLGLDIKTVEDTIKPYCLEFKTLTTAESFD